MIFSKQNLKREAHWEVRGREHFRKNQRNEELADAGLPRKLHGGKRRRSSVQCGLLQLTVTYLGSCPERCHLQELSPGVRKAALLLSHATTSPAEPRGEEGCIPALTCYHKSCVL